MKIALLVVLITAFLVIGCTTPPDDNGNGNGNGGNGGFVSSNEPFFLQFVDASGTPIVGMEIEFAPSRGNTHDVDFTNSRTFTTDAQGKIELTTADVQYLYVDLPTEEEDLITARFFVDSEKVANRISLYDMYWHDEDARVLPSLQKIEVRCYQCEVEEREILRNETAVITIEDFIELIPVPETEVFTIEGNACPTFEDSETIFELPEGCLLSDLGEESNGFFGWQPNVTCTNDALLEKSCIYYDLENDAITEGGTLIKQNSTDKTLIECQIESFYSTAEAFVRGYDYHPGPFVESSYVGYDPTTQEIESLTSWDSLFAFLAPFDSEEKVWEAIRLASEDDLYCSFSSAGYPPQPPEGKQYEEETYMFEDFWIPKEEIQVSSIETTDTGFFVHLLIEHQGCPCYIDYSEVDFELSTEGIISTIEQELVYSALEGCIC